MMCLQMEIRSVLRDLDSDPVAKRVRSRQPSCLCSVQTLLTKVLQDYWVFMSGTSKCGTEVVRSLPQSWCEKSSVYPDCCLSYLVKLWWKQVPHDTTFSWVFGIASDLSSSILLSNSLAGDLTKNLIQCQSFLSGSGSQCWWFMYYFHYEAPSEDAVFEEKPESISSGTSREHGTTDKLNGWGSCSRAPNVTSRAATCPWARWCLIVSIFFQSECVDCRCQQFWTSFVYAFTQTNISGFSILGTFTSVPEHPSVSKILISLMGPTLLSGFIPRRMRPALECVGLSSPPQGVQSIPELFPAGLVSRYCPIFRSSE